MYIDRIEGTIVFINKVKDIHAIGFEKIEALSNDEDLYVAVAILDH